MSKKTLATIIPGTKFKSLLPLRIVAILSCSREILGFYFENCISSAALNLLFSAALNLLAVFKNLQSSTSSIRMNQRLSLIIRADNLN